VVNSNPNKLRYHYLSYLQPYRVSKQFYRVHRHLQVKWWTEKRCPPYLTRIQNTGMCSCVCHPRLLDCGNPCRNDDNIT